MIAALVRHPRPLIGPGICYGRLDLALHPDAAAQTEAICARLADFGPRSLWASPAARCRPAALALASQAAIEPEFDLRLLELDFGAWEGRPWSDIPRAALDRWAIDPPGFAAPSGETGAALIARVTGFHALLRSRNEPCIVVAHAGPLKLLRALLENRPPDLLAPSPPIGSVALVSL